MELMKADLKNKISRFTERRKAFKGQYELLTLTC